MKRQAPTSFRFDKKTRDSLDQLADALSLQRVQVVKLAIAQLHLKMLSSVQQMLGEKRGER